MVHHLMKVQAAIRLKIVKINMKINVFTKQLYGHLPSQIQQADGSRII